MNALKIIGGMFFVAGLCFACSSEEDVTTPDNGPVTPVIGEKVGEINIDLMVNTEAGIAGGVATRSAADVDDAGAPKGVYPFDYVYLVKANGAIPAEEFKDNRKMDISKGARLNIWFTDNTYETVAIQPAADNTVQPLEFRVSKIAGNGKPETIGDTFFYSSRIPGLDNKTVVMSQERDRIAVEFGDNLFLSEQYVFCVEDNQLIIYQVYPVREQVFPKEDNTLWPINMSRQTAGVNVRFMFIDIDKEHSYGTNAKAVASRWNELFKNVALTDIYTDGALLTQFPISFDLCRRMAVSTSSLISDIRVYADEERGNEIQELTYNRASGDVPIATEGWGFKSKGYPFIFPISGLDGLSGVKVNVCVPGLNTKMVCSIPFPEGDGYAFKANTTTFLWMMMDIDEFKALCIKEGVLAEDGTPLRTKTRAAGMKNIEVELPSSNLIFQ